MICLLCLREFNAIFDYPNWNEEFRILEIITKYFGIKAHIENEVSNKMCNACWKHLDDFHRFWLFIKEQQQTFQELCNIKHDPLEDFKQSPFPNDDVKDVQLQELSLANESFFVKPEIDSEEHNTVDSNDEVDSNKDKGQASDDSDYVPKRLHKKLKRNTRHRSCISSQKKKSSSVVKRQKVSSANTAKQLKTDNNIKLKCEICEKESANKYALKKHMYRSHPSELELKYSCNLCNKKFAKKYLLDEHLNMHSTAKKRNLCETCKKGFYTKQELKAHEKSDHADVFKIICDSCGKGFKTRTGYTIHYKQEHLGIVRPQAQCKICKEWLKNDRSLSQHMYKHRDESSGKEFVCNICGAVKSTKKRLSRHKEYHHPNKMHKCSICNKEFKIAIALEEHIAALHTGQPLYSCCFCSHTFKSHANMYTHKRRLHSAEWVPKKHQPRKKVTANKNDALELE